MAETALMLGYPPTAIAELRALRRVMAKPFPPETVDLGLRGAPNLETLSFAAPDLILSSAWYTSYKPQLARIAPVFSKALFVPGDRSVQGVCPAFRVRRTDRHA